MGGRTTGLTAPAPPAARELLRAGRVDRARLRRLDARRGGRETERDRAVERLAALEPDAQAADEGVARADRVADLHARRRVPARLATLDGHRGARRARGDDRRARAARDERRRRGGRSLPDLCRVAGLDRLVGASKQQPLRLGEVRRDEVGPRAQRRGERRPVRVDQGQRATLARQRDEPGVAVLGRPRRRAAAARQYRMVVRARARDRALVAFPVAGAEAPVRARS